MASQLLLGVIAFLPALAIMYFVLGSQEGFFEHGSMFLALLGGLVLGVLVVIAETFMLVDAGLIFIVIAFPLVETMAKTTLVGLPRFRDERETVMLGGATGIMLGAMVFTFYGQSLAGDPVDWRLLVKAIGGSIGFTGAHFVSGMRLGQGPAEGSLLGGFLPSLAWLLPAHVLLGLLGVVPVEGGVAIQPLRGDWVWAVLLALYGVGIFLWRTPDLIRKALPEKERRRMRREQRSG